MQNWQIIPGKWQDSPIDRCDHIITDPPYSAYVHSIDVDERPQSGPKSYGALSRDDLADLVKRCLSVSSRWFIAFCALEQLGDYAAMAQNAYVRSGIYLKKNPMPQFSGDRPSVACEGIAIMHRPGAKKWNGGGRAGSWLHGHDTNEDRLHETPKPLSLMLELIADFTDPGDLIWDPYCGSGTTGIAAIRLGRRFIGHELQDRYVQISRERLIAESDNQTLRSRKTGQCPLFTGNDKGETKNG